MKLGDVYNADCLTEIARTPLEDKGTAPSLRTARNTIPLCSSSMSLLALKMSLQFSAYI